MSSSSSVADDWRIINVSNVGLVSVDLGSVVVAAHNDNGWVGQRSAEGVFIPIYKSGVAGKGAASIVLLVRNLLDLLSTEEKSLVADAAVSLVVIARVPGASAADSIDFDVPSLAKTAAAEPKFIEAANWRHEEWAALVDSVVDLMVGALAAGSVDGVVAEGADAGLLLSWVDLFFSALDQDAWSVDLSIAWTASAVVVGGEVGFVFRASLADVLDDDEAGETDTLAIEEVLVDSAGVDADTFLKKIIIVVAFFTFAADSIDGVKAGGAVAIPGCHIEYLVDTATIALGFVALWYFDGGSAVFAVLCVGEDCYK